MKIMIVEDETFVREGIVSILQSGLTIPFRLNSCADAREAMSVREFSHPDLVITDIEMPDTDGLELIRQMKAANYCDSFITDYYKRLCPQIGPKKALITTSRKMLMTVFAALKKQQEFRTRP